MTTLAVKDASGDVVYLKGTGAGTTDDPFIPQHSESAGGATETTLASIAGYVDGLESSVASRASESTLSSRASESTLSTASGTLASILAKLSADPATQTTLAAVLAKLSADPATQTTLAAVLSALGSPLPLPTGAATQSTLASVLAKLTSDPATATLQGTANTSLASILTALTALQGYVDGLEGFTDGVETSLANMEPAGSFFAVTPHNSTNFSTNARALYVGVAGDVAVVAPDNTVATFVGVPAGTLLPVKAKRVNSTSTTATSIVGMY